MNNTVIIPGTTLATRSICDHNCIFEAEILERKGNFVRVKAMGNIKRVKVFTDSRGIEYIYALGKYSMAPRFSANEIKE